MGQHGGDPDRYVSSIAMGCIPVLLNSSYYGPQAAVPIALPLEEILPWHLFGTVADVTHLDKLGAQLECLRPHVRKLRSNLGRVWRTFLYSSMYGAYLGEERHGSDAFEGIMQVLKSRVRSNYTLPALVRRRMTQREAFFPCVHAGRSGGAGGSDASAPAVGDIGAPGHEW